MICSNNIAGDGLCAVAKAMRSNGALHAVYIWGNKLEEPACRVSAMYIKHNNSNPHIGVYVHVNITDSQLGNIVEKPDNAV